MNVPTIGRRAAAAVGAAALVSTVLITGLMRLETDTSPTTFVPADDPAVRSLVEAGNAFGSDPIVIVAEPAEPKRLLDEEQLPKLFRLEGELSKLDGVSVVYGPATIPNQVAASMQNLLATLSGRRDALKNRAVARARLKGVTDESELHKVADRATREHDLRYGKLLVRGLPAGLPTLRNPRFVERVVYAEDGASRAQWHFMVPTADSVGLTVRPKQGLNQRELESLVRDVRRTVADAELDATNILITGVPGVSVGLAEQIRREVPRLGALALVGIAACYLLLPWVRRRRDRLIPLGVTLVSTGLVLAGFGWLGIPLSLGVVAFLPILLGIASDFPAYLSHQGSRRAVIVAAVASAAAFAALAFSPVPFVRELGLSLAVGQLLAVGLMLLIVPLRGDAQDGPDDQPGPASEAMAPRKRVAVVVAAGLVALVGWISLSSLPVQAEPQRLAAGFKRSTTPSRPRRSSEVQASCSCWFAQVVLSAEVMAWMRATEAAIVRERGSTLRPVLSLSNLLAFLGDSPTQAQIRAAVDLMPDYLVRAVATDDGHGASMTFQLSLQDLGDQARLIREIRASIPAPPDGVEVDVVGMPVVAARGYELMAAHRYLMALAGIAAAAPVLLLGLRSRAAAAQALLAALLATGWGLALATVFGVRLTPLTAALGSLTAAVACEYSVIMSPLVGARHLRRTVTAAAAAAGIGYLSLAFSELAVLREFGWVLAASVALSLAAAHLVLRIFPASAGGPAIRTDDDGALEAPPREKVLL